MSLPETPHHLLRLLRLDKRRLLSSVSGDRLQRLVSYALQGKCGSWGSEFRGKLAILTTKNLSHARALALAVELGHAASLIVDDMVDECSLRRSDPAFWVVFGKSEATLVAHHLVGLAFKVMALNDVPKCAIADLAESLCLMTDAELLSSTDIQTVDDYLRYMEQKTGALVAVAASLFEPDSKSDKKFDKGVFKKVGVLHQIVDDMLDDVQDRSAKTKYGRMNFNKLARSDRRLLLKWKKNLVEGEVVKLFGALECNPYHEFIVHIIGTFIGIKLSDYLSTFSTCEVDGEDSSGLSIGVIESDRSRLTFS